MKKTKDGSEQLEDHMILDSLYGFNDVTSKKESVEVTIQHLLIYGEAFWLIKDKMAGRQIFQILSPESMTPLFDSDGMIRGWKRTWYINNQKQEKSYDSEEIVHFKKPNPFRIGRGQSTIEGIYEWVETDINATEWNRNFFGNNAVPPYVFEAQQHFTPKQMAQMKESFESSTQGNSAAHKIGALPYGAKLTKLWDGMKDMDFANLDERFQDKILAGFSVPKSILGMVKDVNRANVEGTRYIFALYVIKPYMEMIVNTLNEFLIPRITDEAVYLEFENPVPEDIERRLKEIETGLGGQSYMSINEVRAEEGLAPIEGGDAVRGSFGNMPIGEAVKQAKPGSPSKRLFDQEPQKKVHMFNHRKALRQQSSEKLAHDIADGVKQAIREVKISTEDLDAMAWKGLVNRVTPYEKLLADKLIKFGTKLADDVDQNIEEWIKNSKGLADEEGKMLAAIVDLAKPILYGLFAENGQAELAAMSISVPFEIDEALGKVIDIRLDALGRSYEATTVELIKATVQEGLQDGLNVRDIADKVREDVFDNANVVRSEMIANTETFRIANLSTREALKKTEVVKTVRWYTAEDERVCPFCGPLNGKEVAVDAKFFEKGDIVPGSDGETMSLDYDEVWGGALHPNCRCYTRPGEIEI